MLFRVLRDSVLNLRVIVSRLVAVFATAPGLASRVRGMASVLVAVGLLACGKPDVEAVPNVKLGMAPRDVRDRFSPGEQGNWQTSFPERANDDTVLDWSSSSARFDRARFEFHLGMLVAVRAHEREASSGESIQATPKTVVMRRPSEGGTEITVLARDCPTHHDEAESLARRSR